MDERIATKDVSPPPGYELDESYVAYTYPHHVEIWETQSEALVARLPAGTSDLLVSHVTLAYERGIDDGRKVGRREKAAELRRVLDL
ncbi:MAG: hypothetical protein INR70_25425 [Parafilimonas terrae]|nr:hypothetical protein [Parafilimonas terrae]